MGETPCKGGLALPPLTPQSKIKGYPNMISRLSAYIGKKGKGSPHAKYILAQDRYVKKQTELEYTNWGNMPSWAKDNPVKFWEMADKNERANGQVYRELVLSLPRELDLEQRQELVKDFIRERIGDKHAYTVAIHTPTASDGKEQPHAHLMYSQRINDGIDRDQAHYFKRYNAKNPEKGGARKEPPKSPAELKKDLLAERQEWEGLVNRRLEMNGLNPECDMRNWQNKGESTAPINTPIGLYKAMQEAEKALEEHSPEPTAPKPQEIKKEEPAPAPTRSSSYGMGM